MIKIRPATLAGLVVLALAASTAVRAPGPLMNDKSEAACEANAAWLEACFAQGIPARVPNGTLYLRRHVNTPVVVGCGRLESNGSGGYWVPGDHPTLSVGTTPSGNKCHYTSRICQLTPGESIIRLRGAGFICNGPLFFEGQGDTVAFEGEGRAAIATGRHRIRDAVFYNCAAAIKALAGYYENDGRFVPDENHFDNSTVEDCVAFNCDRFWWSQNQQSVNWYFDRCVMEWVFTKPRPVVFADIERGGKVHIDGLEWCTNLAAVFRLRDYSPNNCWLTARGLSYDRMLGPNSYLTLVEYVGDPRAAASYAWQISIDGFVSQPLPREKLYRVAPGFPMNRVDVHLASLYGDHIWPPARPERDKVRK